MTLDERQEIAEYLDIVLKNCRRLEHSIELMQDALGKMSDKTDKKMSAKEAFLQNH